MKHGLYLSLTLDISEFSSPIKCHCNCTNNIVCDVKAAYVEILTGIKVVGATFGYYKHILCVSRWSFPVMNRVANSDHFFVQGL